MYTKPKPVCHLEEHLEVYDSCQCQSPIVLPVLDGDSVGDLDLLLVSISVLLVLIFQTASAQS